MRTTVNESIAWPLFLHRPWKAAWMSAFLVVVLMGSVTGCVTTKLSSKESRIKQVQSNVGCRVLKKVEGTGSWHGTPAEDEQAALNNVREKTARLGGDAFRVIAKPYDEAEAVVIAEALHCGEPSSLPAAKGAAEKLSTEGESCARSADCAGALRCIERRCVAPTKSPSSQPQTQPNTRPTSP